MTTFIDCDELLDASNNHHNDCIPEHRKLTIEALMSFLQQQLPSDIIELTQDKTIATIAALTIISSRELLDELFTVCTRIVL